MSNFESTSLVPRSKYAPAVRRQIHDSPYNPVLHKGMRNPYTGQVISCESEYLEYQREYVYHRLCDDALRRQYSFRLRSISALLVALLLAVSVLLFWYIPRVREDSYQFGRSAGYTEGYTASENAAHSSGYADKGVKPSGSGNATLPRSGVSATTTVYVSRSGHKIHLKSNCSGMLNYDAMSYADALAAGYKHCSKCF